MKNKRKEANNKRWYLWVRILDRTFTIRGFLNSLYHNKNGTQNKLSESRMREREGGKLSLFLFWPCPKNCTLCFEVSEKMTAVRIEKVYISMFWKTRRIISTEVIRSKARINFKVKCVTVVLIYNEWERLGK